MMTGEHFANLSPEKQDEALAEQDRVVAILREQLRRVNAAIQEGRTAALEGKGWGECPYSLAAASQTRVEVVAWKAGFQSGEIEQAEGAHFRTK